MTRSEFAMKGILLTLLLVIANWSCYKPAIRSTDQDQDHCLKCIIERTVLCAQARE